MNKDIYINLILNNDIDFINYIYNQNFEWLFKFSCYICKNMFYWVDLEANDIISDIYKAVFKISKINKKLLEKYWLKPLLKFLVKQEIFMKLRYYKNNKNKILNIASKTDYENINSYDLNNKYNDYSYEQWNNNLELLFIFQKNKKQLKQLSNLEIKILYDWYFNKFSIDDIANIYQKDSHYIKLKLIKINRHLKNFKYCI